MMKQRQPNLPDAELEMLVCLHKMGEATARDVREALEGHRPMAHGSAVTLLGRLESKGLVRKRKGSVGKAFVYSPTRSAGSTLRPVMRKVLTRIFGGNGVALVNSLFDVQPPTPEELEELQALIDEQRNKAKGRPKRKRAPG